MTNADADAADSRPTSSPTAPANIERWMRQGADVTAMLPYLARYMGHASMECADYYIHTSPDFMDAYADHWQDPVPLPEVGFK